MTFSTPKNASLLVVLGLSSTGKSKFGEKVRPENAPLERVQRARYADYRHWLSARFGFSQQIASLIQGFLEKGLPDLEVVCLSSGAPLGTGFIAAAVASPDALSLTEAVDFQFAFVMALLVRMADVFGKIHLHRCKLVEVAPPVFHALFLEKLHYRQRGPERP